MDSIGKSQRYTHHIKIFLPIPHLDEHVISTSKNKGMGFIHINATNKIVMCSPLLYLKY